MILIKNIGLLVGIQPEGVLRLQGPEMSQTGTLPNAWLAMENGRIADFGTQIRDSSCPGGVSTPGHGQGEGPARYKLFAQQMTQ